MEDAIQIYFPVPRNIEGDTTKFRESVDGINFYGVWPSELPSGISIDKELHLLDAGSVECIVGRSPGEEYSYFEIEMRVLRWPDRETWGKTVEAVLKHLVDAGAIAAWCGGELCSPYPYILDNIPELYAIYSPRTGFVGNRSPLIGDWVQLDEALVARVQEDIDDQVTYTHPGKR